MQPSDHIHAHFGTSRDILSDDLFLRLVEEVEENATDSPFTLCRCPALGDGDINLTTSVRESLADKRWVPEAGSAVIGVSSPANGLAFSIEMTLPLDPGHLSDVHFRFDVAYVAAEKREELVRFLFDLAKMLDVAFGYVHHTADVTAQETTDAARYELLTGEKAPSDPVKPEDRPGRSTYAGQHLISCRWLTLFGGRLSAEIGADKLQGAPCKITPLADNLVALRLYDDPMQYNTPESRRTQTAVREALGLDELADLVSWERVKTLEHPAVPSDETEEEVMVVDPDQSYAPALDLFSWAVLYGFGPGSAVGESGFYTDRAREAAGRVLQINCGPGDICLEIARTGVPIVALAPTQEILTHLRSRLAGESKEIQARTTLELGGLWEELLDGNTRFSAVFMPHRAVNRFADPEILRGALERIRELLLPDGVFAFSTFFPQVEAWSKEGGAAPILRYRGQNPATMNDTIVYDTPLADLINQRVDVIRRLAELDDFGEVIRQRYLQIELRYVYPDELRYLLELTGFDASLYGGFDLQPLVSPEQEVVVIARRI